MSSDKFGTRVVELSKRLQISIADALLIIDAEDKIKEQTHKIDQKTEMRSFSYTEESFSDLMNEKLTDEVIGKYAEELLPDLSALTDSILAAISKSDFQILPLALIRNANEILKELNKPNSKDTRRQNFMIWLKTLWLILGFNICGSGRSDLLFKDGIQLPDTKISQLFVEHIFKYVLQNRVAEPDSIEKEEFQNNLSKAAHYVSRRHTKEKSYMRTWATTEKKRTKKAKISKEEVFIRSARINKEIKNTAAKNYTQVPDKYNSQRWANEWNQQDTTGDKSHGNNNISGYNQTEWVPENEEFSQYDNNLNMEPVTKNKSNTTVTYAEGKKSKSRKKESKVRKDGVQSSKLQNSNHLPSLVGETGSKTVKLLSNNHRISLRWVPEPEPNQHAVSSFENEIISSNIKFREAKEKCNNLNVVQRSQQDRKTLTSKSMNSSSKLLTHQQAKATPEYATTSLLSFSTAPTLENSIGHKSSSNSSNKRPLEGDENNLLLLYI